MNAHDVVNFAIRIEENGERFYREAAEIISSAPVKELFERLAKEETIHRKTFEKLLSSLGDYQPPEEFEGEYMVYLKDFIDGKAVFKAHPRIPDLAKAGSVAGALDFAMQREMDSILYYQELKRFVGPGHTEPIDLIIDEERMHFAFLSRLHKEVTLSD